MKYEPPAVIAVHGIRTEAKWQKLLGEVAGDHGVKVRLFDYGNFNTARFLFGPSRRKKIREFYQYYSTAVSDKNLNIDLGDFRKRPSVVAHSLGTYIVANCMLKHRDVKFDKIILCGSILPEDFDWSHLLGRDQVDVVRNECGHRDFWSGIVGNFVGGTGKSGKSGFAFDGASLKQEHFELHEHSDAFYRSHIENEWFPFLAKQPTGFQVTNGRDIQNRAEFSKMLDVSHGIDLKYYVDLPHFDEVDLPRGLSLTWIDINPDIYTFLLDRADNKVKGYINAMPIDDVVFERIKAGVEVEDNKIKAADIALFQSHQKLRIYLMSIAIEPSALQASEGLFQAALEKLLYGFFEKLIWYAVDRKIRVTEFVAVGWTGKGEKLCRAFGMEKVGEDHYDHSIYWINLSDPTILIKKRLFPALRRLLNTYQELGL
jgi:pimeloyl-ACP methyl ester carboxylesterase